MDRLNSKEECCMLCNVRPRIYTCPRCGIGYCNLDCYKSEMHLECSESFYQQCIEDDLKSSTDNPEMKQNMMSILKKLYDQDLEDNILEDDDEEDTSQLDSDDNDSVVDLEERLQNVNLNNGDEIWSILNDAEKQEFQALVKSGEVDKLLPQWTPWWTLKIKKELIEDLGKNIENKNEKKEVERIPKIIEVSMFDKQWKVSPKVRFNLINMIYSYIYVALYYQGDYLDYPMEATNIFFSVCDNINQNRTFDDEKSAFESVVNNINNCQYVSDNKEMSCALEESGNFILRGSDRNGTSIYICAALSEAWRLLNATKDAISKDKCKAKPIGQQVSKKFGQIIIVNNKNITKRNLYACLKKLEYYISWVKMYGSM